MTGELALCHCGAKMPAWQTFCRTCYAKLPVALREPLRRHEGDDPDSAAYRSAAAWLDERERGEEAKRAALRVDATP